MTTMKRLVTAALVTAFLAAPLGAAQEGGGPEAREEADKIVLANDDVTVWFQGKKPFLKVFPTDGNESDAFTLRFHRLVEFQDANDNGVPDEGEIASFLNLESAKDWQVALTEDGDVATLNLTLQAPVRHRGPMKDLDVEVPTRDANVSLVFHIYTGATQVSAGPNVTVDVPAGAVKYDFIVNAWPWLDAEENRLALDVATPATLTDVMLEDAGAASVAQNDTVVGALTWTHVADGVTQDGENVTVNVTAAVRHADANDTEDADAENLTRLVFVYDAPNLQSLVHDPTVGVASAATDAPGDDGRGVPDVLKDVPAPGLALAAAAVGAAAFTLRRRDG